jgi:hypothetical protein
MVGLALVFPAKAGIQRLCTRPSGESRNPAALHSSFRRKPESSGFSISTGFRVKPGMTNSQESSAFIGVHRRFHRLSGFRVKPGMTNSQESSAFIGGSIAFLDSGSCPE